MPLSLQIYENAKLVNLQGDWTWQAEYLVVENDERGFGIMRGVVRLVDRDLLYRAYEALPGSHAILTDGAFRAFEGRIEDVTLEGGAIEFAAYGYWRALYDAPYTSLWSERKGLGWYVPLKSLATGSEQYQIEFDQDFVRLNLRPGEAYESANPGSGAAVYESPHTGRNDINYIKFDYSYRFPDTNWRMRLLSYTESHSTAAVDLTLTPASTAVTTGTTSVILANARPRIVVQALNNSSVAYVESKSTAGYHYAQLSNFRIQSTSTAIITADVIIDDMVSFISGINSTQLNSATAAIQSPGVDMPDEIIQDRYPGDVILDYAERGDNSSPPKRYEALVRENQLLVFRQRGLQALTWYVEASDITLSQSLAEMYNSAYSVYTSNSIRAIRTATSANASSTSRYFTRRMAAQMPSTSSTAATTKRDVIVNDKKEPGTRGRLEFRHIFDAANTPVPKYVPRPGDTIIVRNLPPGVGTSVDKVRRFTIARTIFDVFADRLEVVPELDPESLSVLVAGGPAGGQT